jgi:hypothetical protein
MPDPNVVYHFDLRTIDVDVVVEADGTGNPRTVAALPVLRPGQWMVTWTLKGFDNLSPIFDLDEGIKITNKPADLNHDVGQRVSDTEWSMAFENNCESANAATYLINFHFPPSLEDIRSAFHHDPSISVVSDPPAG